MKSNDGFIYQTEVSWTESRCGELTSGGLPDIRVAAPPEFQGKENSWTPEHLFVASVNACFVMTFLAVAENSKLEIASLSASATGKLEKLEGAGYRITEIVLRPKLALRSAGDLDRAKRILEKAQRSCPISHSIKSVVRLEPEIVPAQAPEYACPFAVV